MTQSLLRQAFSQFAAGVSIITTTGSDGEKIGLTATAVTSVSLEPPLLLVCIGHWSRAVAPLRAGAPFVVHFLDADQEELARHFATSTPDKFAAVAHRLTANGCPRLETALASFECIPQQTFPAGDHHIVVGRVVDLQISDEERPPLVYFRRQFDTVLRRAS
jgi:flavin reductase (DIM6/NTAB) family NADH-FMN oxidoreductase RutF